MKTVRRFDGGQLSKAEITPEGFLRAPAFLTRIGVFEYADAEGKVTRELRRPEQVFDAESLRSFALLPVTDNHPECGYVDASTARALQRGSIGEIVTQDGDLVRTTIMITDGDLVRKVKSGEQAEISNGYSCVVKDGAGEWQGMRYDCEQTMIRGNHVAMVPRGRAGPAARVKLDAQDAIALRRDPDEGDRVDTDRKEIQMNKKIKIHGIEFEVPVAVADAIEAQRVADSAAYQAKIDAGDAAAKKAQADFAAIQAKADAAGAEVTKLKADAVAAVAAQPKAVVEAIAVIDVARRAGVEVKIDALDLLALKRAVAEKVNDVKLDGKDALYVAAAFDIAKAKVDDAPVGANLLAVVEDRDGVHADEEVDPRAAMAKRNEDAWKPAAAKK